MEKLSIRVSFGNNINGEIWLFFVFVTTNVIFKDKLYYSSGLFKYLGDL